MATVLKMTEHPVASIREAFNTLSLLRDTVAAMPEVGNVSIRMDHFGALRVEIVVGGLPTIAVENQQKIMFKIENNMIAGYPLVKPVTGFEHGTSGKRTVTALIDTRFGA